MSKLVCIACAAAFTCTATAAAPLRLLSDERSVGSGGSATTITSRTYYDGSVSSPTVVQDVKPAATTHHTRDGFGLFAHSEGLSLRTPAATVDGQGYQLSTLATDGFSFQGVADVFASASREETQLPDHTETTEGDAGGSANVALRWTFAIDADSVWRFAGSHNLYDARGGSGSYTLAADSGFVWDDLGESSFSTVLQLAPGTYTFAVRLDAFARESYQGDRGGRASANFTLTAVPEPATLALLAPGLLLVVGLARRRQRITPATASRH